MPGKKRKAPKKPEVNKKIKRVQKSVAQQLVDSKFQFGEGTKYPELEESVFHTSNGYDLKAYYANNSEFLKMHGKGEGLLIGHEPSLSEPLVLGNTLHAMLETILHNSIESFTLIARSLNNLQDQIKDIETSYASHTHNITSPAPGSPTSPSPALVPRAQMPILPIDVSTIEDSGILIKELEDINKNLVQMLSRFAKTT